MAGMNIGVDRMQELESDVSKLLEQMLKMSRSLVALIGSVNLLTNTVATMGQEVRPIREVDITKEDIERIRKLGYIPTTIPENELGVRFCCPYCYKTSVYEFSTGNVTKESDKE